MSGETTPLLAPVKPGPQVITRAKKAFYLDLLGSALCIILKLTFYLFKYLILFRQLDHTLFVLLLVLGECANRTVSIFWCEFILCFETVVFERARTIWYDPEQPEEVKHVAIKANRKSASIPELCQTFLEVIVDQHLTSFMAFSKAGCTPTLAFGASIAMSSLAFMLQLGGDGLISQVTMHRRHKENM